MAINKDDFKNTQGNYEAKNSLIDALIDATNAAIDLVESHMAESANKHITESGSNENGSYIKFDDGTMICCMNKVLSADITELRDGLYRSNNLGAFYPSSFIEEPSITVAFTGQGNSIPRIATLYRVEMTGYQVFVVSGASATSVSIDWRAIAVGRWK